MENAKAFKLWIPDVASTVGLALEDDSRKGGGDFFVLIRSQKVLSGLGKAGMI